MKLRHAAALALMGWYLMVPPFSRVTHRILTSAPVSKWENFNAMNDPKEGGFRSLARCEEFRTSSIEWWGRQKPEYRDDLANRITYQQLRLGKCIAHPNPSLDPN